jgi:hypothetical protein
MGSSRAGAARSLSRDLDQRDADAFGVAEGRAPLIVAQIRQTAALLPRPYSWASPTLIIGRAWRC